MTRQFRDPRSGMSLLETMVAIGIFGIVVLAGARVISMHGAMTKEVNDTDEIFDLRQFVRNSLSCDKTFAAASAVTTCRATGAFWMGAI